MRIFIMACLAFSMLPGWAQADVLLADLVLKYGIGSRPGIVHGQLTNNGNKTVHLISVTSPSFGRIELHTHEKTGELMRMRKVERYAVEAGQSLSLKPGGKHLMLFEPKSTDKQAPIALTFTFDDGQEVRRHVTPMLPKMRHSPDQHMGHH
ncbi:copper chaperone PCu(A)C [Alphaproteobacteria bacterium]|nr:copper chaperone PCu(A)C [Alphaproteobacteria bacterium]